jgi:hypothetical protein
MMSEDEVKPALAFDPDKTIQHSLYYLQVRPEPTFMEQFSGAPL